MNDATKKAVAVTGLGGDLLAKLQSGVAASRSLTVVSGGKPFLRMLRDGGWVYGQQDAEVQDGSSWAINPLSIQHGWCCWPKADDPTANKMLGERMVSVQEPRPPQPEPIQGVPFTEQRAFELRCMDGEDAGVEVLYKASSRGGLNAIDKLLSALQVQLANTPSHPCPVVQLQCDSYQHAKYGRIYIPVLDVVDWSDMSGNLQSDLGGTIAPPQATPAPQPKPATMQAAPEEPAPTARRRPVRR